MTQLILIRHGETDLNRELRFQGHSDVPLNAAGLVQAQSAALAIALAGEPVYKIISSDLLRARQTAEVIAAGLPQPPQKGLVIDAAWRERSFGELDGLRVADIQQQHPQHWQQWLECGPDDAMAGIESTRSLNNRVMAAVQALAVVGCRNNIVVVTHGGVLDMIYRRAQGLPLEGPRRCDIPNAGINRVAIHHDAAANWQLIILEWALAEHLRGLPPQAVYKASPACDASGDTTAQT
ncbi:MAG: histidine phosphatase family protein [Burkholderiaceae bacterium]